MSRWILLRGLTREARHWGAFAERLRGMGGAFADRVTLIDLPGNGAERMQKAPLDVRAMTAFVRARAADRGVAPPYRLIAMSLGGMVATEWAQRHPDEIERLVLINTSMRPFARVTERLRPAAWPALVRVAAAWPDAPRSEAIIHALTCNRRDTAAADIAHWADIRRSARVNAALSDASAVVGGGPAGRSGVLCAHRVAVACVARRASLGRPRPASRRPRLDEPGDRRLARGRGSLSALTPRNARLPL